MAETNRLMGMLQSAFGENPRLRSWLDNYSQSVPVSAASPLQRQLSYGQSPSDFASPRTTSPQEREISQIRAMTNRIEGITRAGQQAMAESQNRYASPLANFGPSQGQEYANDTANRLGYQPGVGMNPAAAARDNALARFRMMPGGQQMMDRFGGGPIGQDGQTAASGQPYMQVGGYGSPLTRLEPPTRDPSRAYEDLGPTRAFGGGRSADLAYTSRRQQIIDRSVLGEDDPEAVQIKQEIDRRKKEVAARRRDLGLPVGAAERRAAREADRLDTLARRQARQLQGMGVSPLSATGQSLAPELYDRMQQQRQSLRSPLTNSGAITISTPDGKTTSVPPAKVGESNFTPNRLQEITAGTSGLVSGSPLLKQAGVTVSENGSPPSPAEISGSLFSYLSSNPGVNPTPEDLKSLHQMAIQFSVAGKVTGQDPFVSGPFTNNLALVQFRQLSQIPIDNEQQRMDWFKTFRAGQQVDAGPLPYTQVQKPPGLLTHPPELLPHQYTW